MIEGRKPKIAVVGLTFPFRGGIAHHSSLLVRELRKRYSVTFFTFLRQYPEILFPGKTQYDYSAERLREEDIPLIDTLNPLTWVRVAFAVKREKVDLVIIQWWNPFFGLAFGTIANLLKIITKAKVCFVCHNVLPHESTWVDRILSRYAFLSVRNFIVHSEEDKRHLLALKNHATVRRSFHPTYSIFGEFGSYQKREARHELGLCPSKRVLLFFGLVRAYKGLKYLIEAMAIVVKSFDCVLLVVGEFYDGKEEYRTQIARLGLENHVVIRDEYVKNEAVALYFSSADVVVLPYVTATQSGIVQIAFGLGKPVITTNVGGLPEAVKDGETGFVVEPESPAKLADAILRFYAGDYESKFSQTIKKNADVFSWDAEVETVESFLDAS
jgi:glycosyltransferase involved in cell wall biosynthesis